MLKRSGGALEMAQWLNHLPHKLEDGDLDFQTPHKCQIGVETQFQCLEGGEREPSDQAAS